MANPHSETRRQDETTCALVFSGGGARGAYEAGAVRYLVEELPKRLGWTPRFDVVCGTSVGAIHACYMAATAHMDESRGAKLVDFWARMRLEEVLPLSPGDMLRWPGRLLGLRRLAEKMRKGNAPERLYGLFDTRALEQLVVEAIPWRSLHTNIQQGLVNSVCVSATQLSTGRSVNFIETNEKSLPPWTRDATLLPKKTRLRPTHALASAAIPLLFPAVRVARSYYADGGLRLNTPLAPALRLGAERVLVIALRQNMAAVQQKVLATHRMWDYASPAYLFGKVLNSILLDHLETDLARMQVLNEIIDDGETAWGKDFLPRVNDVAIAKRGQAFRRIHEIVLRPSEDLGQLAGSILRNMPEEKQRSPLLKLAARSVDDDERPAESDLLSYLLFDGEFSVSLAELGFRDAQACEEQLCEFFTGGPS
ncbi:patatin-like phospholipase family protein [Myxococcota bacterium]|nr:patatin-like phospholipase family protein [Myxococcota bacterium]